MLEFTCRIRTPTLEICYADAGPPNGPPVILLHGWPDAARAWISAAARLNAAGFRTIVPELRGSGRTRFISDRTVRDGSGVALAQDAIDLANALSINRFDLVGHDWGARAAYTVAALFPERAKRIAALALAFQPYGRFALPGFSQARKFWYQWFMSLDGGPDAVGADPKGFARIQWETWSPPESHFTGGYRRILIEGVGHFPLREAPDEVANALIEHLR